MKGLSYWSSPGNLFELLQSLHSDTAWWKLLSGPPRCGKCTTVWEWSRDLLCKAPFRQRIMATDNSRSIVRGWDGKRFPGCINQCENICTSILSRLWVQEEKCEVCLPKGLASLSFALFVFITIRKVTFFKPKLTVADKGSMRAWMYSQTNMYTNSSSEDACADVFCGLLCC